MFESPRTAKLLTLLALVLPATAAFGTLPGDTQETLTWTGCGITKKAFMAEAVKAYEAETGVKIELSGGGATKGIRFVDAGMSVLGGCCRPAFSAEFPNEEGGVFMTVVAWDALVPIVHPDNPLESITTEQLKRVMTGSLNNWSELGGEDRPIQVFVRKGKISGVGAMARRLLFDNPDLEYGPAATVVRSSGPAEEAVEADPYAITITGVSSAIRRKVKIVALDGVHATPETIATGEYATFRPLYIAHTITANMGKARAFLDWLISDAGQAIVESCGTVSLRTGVTLPNRFKHWTDVERVTNYPQLKKAADAAMARQSK